MVEQPEPQFDAPIPGASLTAEVGGSPYKNPPQHSTLEQALAGYMETMQDESFIDNLVAGLEMGVPVTTIANMIQLKGVMDGLHNIDVSILIMPIIMEMIAYIAESRKWKFAEHVTHTYLKNVQGLSRGKLHIQENIKRNVYTLDEVIFKEEDFKHETIVFAEKKEVM